MKKLPIEWANLQFGATFLNEDIRELTLLDDQFEEKGAISFHCRPTEVRNYTSEPHNYWTNGL